MNKKQRQFANEYLVDRNGSKAVIRAGYAKKHADSMASRLLAKPDIKAYVNKKLKDLEDKTQLTAELVREKVLALLLFDLRDAFNTDGTMKEVSSLPDGIAVAITGIEVDDSNGDVKKLRFTDRIRAAELAAKILGMVNRLEITGKNGRPLVPAIPQIDFSKVDHKTLLRIAGMRDDDAGDN